MQTIWINSNDKIEELAVPPASQEVLTGVRWGAVDEWFTPAFWKCQSELHIRKSEYTQHRLGGTLAEEVAVCLLGGYGIPAEMGLMAFDRLKSRNLLYPGVSEEILREHLAEPFTKAGKSRRYRFYGQKAKYLSRSLSGVEALSGGYDDIELRTALMGLPGIGPKTASWIVRNHRHSDAVAIIDIHLHRAGRMIGLFANDSEPTRDYLPLEAAFLKFCQAISVRASVLDALIWDYMRRAGPTSGLTEAVKGQTHRQSHQFALAV